MSLNSVRQLRPRVESFESAVSAYRAAEYAACLLTLNAHSSSEASALRARVLLRLGRVEAARDAIGGIDVAALTVPQAADVLTVRAFAEMAAGEVERAEDTLLEARIKSYCSGSSALEADAEYTGAVLYWSQGRRPEAEAQIERVLAVPAEGGECPDQPHLEPLLRLAESRARALDLRGRLAAADGRYEEQVALVARALAEIRSFEAPDRYIEAHLLLNVAVLIKDLDFPDVAAIVREHAERITFSEFTRPFEFEIRRSLGWCHALQGDHVGALREFRRSADAAPNDALRMHAVLDRACLAREIHETTCAEEESEHALALSKAVDWHAFTGDERFALLELARNLARRRPLEARRILDRYLRVKRAQPVTSGARGDRRVAALEMHVTAAVLEAEGQRDRAVTLLLDALQAYTQTGYLWRASAVAADLFDLTGEAHYYRLAVNEAAKRPRSWLMRRLELARSAPATCGGVS